MRISIIGYGKMGQTIEKIALSRGHEIVSIIDKDNFEDLARISSANCDVAIEFTNPDVAFQNITSLLNQKVAVVTGTTGWLDKLDVIRETCDYNNGSFFYASNYSIGANIFIEINKKLASLMNGKGYDVWINETHHTEKKDSPSGTAITLAEGIIENMEHLNKWSEGQDLPEESLSIKSFREPDVPGTHEINYNSEADEIMIRHTAHSRQGFALGAVVAAEWLVGKKGVFTMQDMLGS